MKKNKELDYPLLAFFGAIFFVIYIIIYTDGITQKYGEIPQILLCATAFSGMFWGEKMGAVFGFIIGAGLDAVSIKATCFNSIICLLLGYFCGVAVSRIINNNFKSSLIVMLVVSVIYNLFKCICGIINFNYLLNQAPYTIFLTVICSIPLYWFMHFIIVLRKRQLLKRK